MKRLWINYSDMRVERPVGADARDVTKNIQHVEITGASHLAKGAPRQSVRRGRMAPAKRAHEAVASRRGKHREDVSEVLELSKGVSKLIPIDEQPNHQIVHLFRLGKANCTTHQTLDPGP